MNYTIIREAEGFYSVLSRGEQVGPYRTEAELVRDMESIERHLAAGCFAGAK